MVFAHRVKGDVFSDNHLLVAFFKANFEMFLRVFRHPAKDVGIHLSDPAVALVALKKAEDEERIILRLFESKGERRKVKAIVPFLKKEFEIDMEPFELKSIAFDTKPSTWCEVNLLEMGWD